MRQLIIILICLTLCGPAASAFAEEANKPADTEPENLPENLQSAETDPEIVEIIELLKMMELLKEMEFIRDYHLFAEEETDETKN